MRREDNGLREGVEDLPPTAPRAHVPAEIYHLKAAGEPNWPKMDDVIRRVETARASGLRITADMYTYRAGATRLDAALPPWGPGGGYQTWRETPQDTASRARALQE